MSARHLENPAALDNLCAGGARNPHLPTSKLRFLRSGDTQILFARDGFSRCPKPVAEVLRDPRVWQGPRHALPEVEPTGHAALDAALPGGGLPIGALTEVLHEFDGINEMTLLLPLIARLTRSGRRIVFVHPPYIPYAPAFVAAGVDPWAMHTIANCGDEGLWAAEQALRSATCALVACWPKQANDRQLRRLQLAAEGGRAIAIAFRPARVAAMTSPAAVRLQADADGIRVLKCRGGNAHQQRIAIRNQTLSPEQARGRGLGEGAASQLTAAPQSRATLPPHPSPLPQR